MNSPEPSTDPAPSIQRIKNVYRDLGLTPETGWDRERFYRLCNYLRVTPKELACACAIFRDGDLKRWIKANHFPSYVALNFMMIERAYLQQRHQTTPLNPITDALKECYREN